VFASSFSPDGRWILYRSDESGRNEFYVRPFPAGGGKWPISSEGAIYAFWSNDGRTLFYEAEDSRIMVVDYTVEGDAFVPGKPRVWSERQIPYMGTTNLDLAPDGKHFAVLAAAEGGERPKGSVHVTMLENLFDELRRRLPWALWVYGASPESLREAGCGKRPIPLGGGWCGHSHKAQIDRAAPVGRYIGRVQWEHG